MWLLTWHFGPCQPRTMEPFRRLAQCQLCFFFEICQFFPGSKQNNHWYLMVQLSCFWFIKNALTRPCSGTCVIHLLFVETLVGQPFGILNLSINQVQLLSLIIMLNLNVRFFCSLRQYDYNWLLKHVFFWVLTLLSHSFFSKFRLLFGGSDSSPACCRCCWFWKAN